MLRFSFGKRHRAAHVDPIASALHAALLGATKEPLVASTGCAAPDASILSQYSGVTARHPTSGRPVRENSPAAMRLADCGLQVDPQNPYRFRFRCKPQDLSFRCRKNPVVARWFAALEEQLLCSPCWTDEQQLRFLNDRLDKSYDALTAGTVSPKLLSVPATDDATSNLNDQQLAALEEACSGASLYIGGPAGTGKTKLLQAIHRALCGKGLNVALTATTGAAAVHLGGTTFHHAVSMPIASHDSWDYEALRALDVVIIDEVSLWDAGVLDMFDAEARAARLSMEPFGGLQVILCGDFLQLVAGEAFRSKRPCFRHPLFQRLRWIQLQRNMRQTDADDEWFRSFLGKLRLGEIDHESLSRLTSKVVTDDIMKMATIMLPKRDDAHRVNSERLLLLPGEQHVLPPAVSHLQLFHKCTHTAVVSAPKARQDAFAAAVRKAFLDLRPQEEHFSASSDVVVIPAAVAGQFLVRVRIDRPDIADPTSMTGQQHRRRNSAKKHNAANVGMLSDASQWEDFVRRELLPAVALTTGSKCELISMHDQDPMHLLPSDFLVGCKGKVIDALRSDAATRDALLLDLKLKVGARVIVLRNLSRSVSNGSVGTVVALAPPTPAMYPDPASNSRLCPVGSNVSAMFALLPVVRFHHDNSVFQIPPVSSALDGKSDAYFYGLQIAHVPLQLAYAFTVHKSQGLSIDGPVVLDTTSSFHCHHMMYVAMSRVRHSKDLYLKAFRPEYIQVQDVCRSFLKEVSAREGIEQGAEPTGSLSGTSWTPTWKRRRQEMREVQS